MLANTVPPKRVESSLKYATTPAAFAALKFARSVASRLFSNCDVKIGIDTATKTPMIATASSSSVIMNYLASKAGPSSYALTCLLNGSLYNQRSYHSGILHPQSPFRDNLYHILGKLFRMAYMDTTKR